MPARCTIRLVAATALWAALLVCPAAAQNGQAGRELATRMVDQALASGDGRTQETAFVVEGLLWEYAVLARLGMRLQRHASQIAGGQVLDTITAYDPARGESRQVWFRVAPGPSNPGERRSDPEVDRVVRAILTSGDGNTPDTAFDVGGRIGAEYQILRYMGLQSQMQALQTIRGCMFDVLTARDPASGETRQVYFALGRNLPAGSTPCVLEPAGAPR